MKESWLKLEEAWDRLSLRERALALAALLAALYGSIDALFIRPMELEHKRLAGELTRSVEDAQRLDARARLLGEQLEEGIPASLQREERALHRQIERLHEQIEERMVSMIPPGEVPRMLEALLAEESELTLVKLSSVEKPKVVQRGNASDAASAPEGEPEFYRHGFVLELEGSYFATLHYLEAIESLSWDLSWDRIVYEVTDYPLAHISIELHTLSDQENWIGV